MLNKVKIAVDAMGGKGSPKKIIDGIEISLKSNQKATLMVRPEYVRFLDKSSKADFIVRGILMAEFALGSRTHYEVETSNGQIVTVEKLREDRFKGKSGASVTLGFDLENVHTIKVSNGKS